MGRGRVGTKDYGAAGDQEFRNGEADTAGGTSRRRSVSREEGRTEGEYVTMAKRPARGREVSAMVYSMMG